MCLAAVYFFISFAGRTNTVFYIFHEPEQNTLLLITGPRANGAVYTLLRELPVFFGDGFSIHILVLVII